MVLKIKALKIILKSKAVSELYHLDMWSLMPFGASGTFLIVLMMFRRSESTQTCNPFCLTDSLLMKGRTFFKKKQPLGSYLPLCSVHPNSRQRSGVKGSLISADGVAKMLSAGEYADPRDERLLRAAGVVGPPREVCDMLKKLYKGNID